MNNKYKILLVEDEHNISTLIMTMLESSGYQVIRAGTCALAKTLFVSHCPDLVLLDLGLPDMDGMTFLEDVRKDSLTPIIVLSARTNEKDKVLALDAGANPKSMIKLLDWMPVPMIMLQSLLAQQSFWPESAQPFATIPTVQNPANFRAASLWCRIWRSCMMPDRSL